MREIDPALQARLDTRATCLCRCWLVTRADGTELGFTDHDRDLWFDGHGFQAGSGMDARALQSSTGLSVDNSAAAGALNSESLSEADILAGRYDGAEIRLWLVDWENPSLNLLLFRGFLGDVERSGNAFEAELRGLTEALNRPVGRAYVKSCDRDLGDGKCGFDLNTPGFSGDAAVVEASGNRLLTVTGLESHASGWFDGGGAVWQSGANAGAPAVVREHVVAGGYGRLKLWEEATGTIKAGDVLRVFAGCDKRIETCQAKFGNLSSFRGYPHIPADDWVTAYPVRGGKNDGGKL